MKRRRIISLMLVFIMLLAAVPSGPQVFASRVPSNWAVDEMNDANTTGLLSHSAARDFHRPLTRDEFCELVVVMVERTLGKPLVIPATNPFVDDVDPISIHALKAWNYGIITGVTATKFSPRNSVLREQLCAMMIRAIRKLEGELNRVLLSPGTQHLPYGDVSQIRPYALDAVKLAHSNKIMEGHSSGNFRPMNNISSEECVAVIIRSFNRIEELRAPSMTTSQLLSAAENRLYIGFAYGDTEHGVSQNVTLPLTSAGNATVTWISSNNGIISISGATGIVNAGSVARNVILTATIRIGNSTRVKEFDLTTSPHSGDRLLVENAQEELEIVYINSGDSAASVTGRIGLPASVLGLPVSWHSSSPSVVSTSGNVNVPSGNEVRSVTLTATVTSGSQSRMKIFNLTVVNPAFNAGATLHNVQLGMTPAQVTSLLGTVRQTISASNTESWQLYYNTNHSNFIAVAFINSRAVAVYSMASGVASQLRNRGGTVITVAQANAMAGINAVSYTDPGSSSQVYAIMISESSSVIGTPRTLRDEGQEQFLFELINAFRVRNNRSVLEWTARLGAPARAHSSNRGSGSLEQRVTSGGFDLARYEGGNTVAGAIDAIDALRQIVNSSSGSSAMRTQIMQSSLTLFGAGFSGGHSGSISTYFTYALGAATVISSVTARQNNLVVSTVNINTGAANASVITLTMSPASFNESFTVTSSNTHRFTVSNVTMTSTGATVTVTGVANGSGDNLVVTGNCSGKQLSIPVVVGPVFSTGMTLSYMNTTLTSSSNSANANATATGSRVIVMGTNDVLTIAAAPNVASSVVEWTRQSGSAATVAKSGANNDGVVTAGSSPGDITIRARVQTGNNTHITHTITVRVVSVTAMTVFPETISVGASTTANVTVTLPTGSSAIPVPAYTWTTTGNQLTRTSSATEIPAFFTGANQGASTVTLTAEWTGTTQNSFLGRVVRTANVTVQGSQFADGIIINPDTIFMVPGQTLSVQASTVPALITQAYSLIWSVENGASAAVIGSGANDATGRVTANSNIGTTWIRAILSQGSGPVRSAILTVNVAWPELVIIQSSVPLVVQHGATFTATTSPAALPEAYTIRWSRNVGNDVMSIGPDTGEAWMESAGPVTVTAELFFNGVSTGKTISRDFVISI